MVGSALLRRLASSQSANLIRIGAGKSTAPVALNILCRNEGTDAGSSVETRRKNGRDTK